jgi:hypothetical protein
VNTSYRYLSKGEFTMAKLKSYKDGTPFTGTIKRVTIDLSGELIPDSEAELKIAMALQ